MGLGGPSILNRLARNEMSKMSSIYEDYMDDLYDIQSKASKWSGRGNLLSMFGGPFGALAGLGMDAISTAYYSGQMPDDLDFDPNQFEWTPRAESTKMESGANDAAAELEASLWAGLQKHFMNAYSIHGKEMFSAAGEIGEKIAGFELPGFELPSAPDWMPGGEPWNPLPSMPKMPKLPNPLEPTVSSGVSSGISTGGNLYDEELLASTSLEETDFYSSLRNRL